MEGKKRERKNRKKEKWKQVTSGGGLGQAGIQQGVVASGKERTNIKKGFSIKNFKS